MDRDKEIVYVHCKDMSSFTQFQNKEENKDRDCHYITDEYFLRGRWPAKIIILEDAIHNHFSQAIMESIDIHKDLWSKDLDKIVEKEELGGDYKEDDEIYGVN